MKFKTFSRIVLLAIFGTSFTFSANSAFIMQGSSSPTGNDCYIITPDYGGETGAVWYSYKMDLAYNFDMSFQVYLGTKDYEGADGIAFVLQALGTGVLGSGGGGIGYEGLTPSIAVEYDTWQNDDPEYDHIAVQRNGDYSSYGTLAGPVQAAATASNIEDGQWHTSQIVWDATTMTMTIYFDGNLRLTFSNDLVANTFNGNSRVNWGFTGGTGAAFNLQQFCITSISFKEVPPEVIPLSPWVLLMSIFLILTVTVFRYKRSL